MARVDFYHLSHWPLEQALPRLIERVARAGLRAAIVASSEERVEALNALLWTQPPDSWLPHGSDRDGRPERQPVWLGTSDEPPNGASVLVLTDGASSARLAAFDRCLDLFDGGDEQALAAARGRWRLARSGGHELHYWQQSPGGGWTEKQL